MDERDAAWLRVAGAGGRKAPLRRLLAAHGDAVAALAAGRTAWRAAGCDDGQIAALARPAAVAAPTRRWLATADHHLLGWSDAGYPPALRHASSPPLLLYVEGTPAVLDCPMLAVVGTRSPSLPGRDLAFAFARAAAECGVAIVSGLASGIDGAAHAGALAARDGRTVAVLGSGPERAYPTAHTHLRDGILAGKGAVLSELPPGTPVRREHFPRRNRIIAGLATGVLVVEAAEQSGALITARLAADAGREVYAVPGSVHNPMARGCHRLIREGATLVETPDELLALLHAALRHGLADAGTAMPPAVAAMPQAGLFGDVLDHNPLWQCLGTDPMDMDALVDATGLTVPELSAMLLGMELDGRVVVEHGRYARRPPI